ncbi:MAG: endonuclease/exonuclease/phosphatase family protein [Candidatus Woesearchaeota archaeon]
MNNTIKVLSINIEAGVNNSKGYIGYITTIFKNFFPHSNGPLYALADYINKEKIDIVSLTEVDGGSFRTRHVSQLKILSSLTGLEHHSFNPTYKFGKIINQGDGLLSRFPEYNREYYKLKSKHPRYLEFATADVDGQQIKIIVTHLSLGRKARIRELKQIASVLLNFKTPKILTGDFNTENPEELDIIKQAGLTPVHNDKTFPSWKPKRSIDHIFFSKEFEIIKTNICPLHISDHLGIVAELKIKK